MYTHTPHDKDKDKEEDDEDDLTLLINLANFDVGRVTEVGGEVQGYASRDQNFVTYSLPRLMGVQGGVSIGP